MKIFTLAFALAALWAAPLAGSLAAWAEPRDPAAETADALYAAPDTVAAIEKADDPALRARRARIEVLAAQAPTDPAARAALTAAEEDLIATLSARDADYGAKISALRLSLNQGAKANPPASPARSASFQAWQERQRQGQSQPQTAAQHYHQGGGGSGPRSPGAAARPAPGLHIGGISHHAPSPALPNFPWPPPTPSERLNLTRAQSLPASSGRDPSLAYVADRIIGALQAAGYSEYSVYAAPHGFAIVARLERIKPDGTPAPEALRFLAPDASEPFSLAAYVQRLFFAPEGDYRQIVFLVTSEVVRPSGPAPSAAAAEALLQGGADRLPAEYRRIPFTADDQVAALVYEYHKGPNVQDVKTLTPGRLDARTNLIRAGLYARLVGGN
jgi:hypothetical protein